jgi:hypothetical protein
MYETRNETNRRRPVTGGARQVQAT